MRVKQLDIQGLRIIREASVNTDASLVVLAGENASGKTSFLEAISTLFSGRSFRTRHSTHLINKESSSYLVRGVGSFDVDYGSGFAHGVAEDFSIATELKHRQAPKFRVNAEDARPSELVRNFPLQIIDAGIFDLIEGSPSHRRRFVDWGMFHVKQEFYPAWKKHRKIAAHWNALLRDGRSSEVTHWQQGFVETSECLAAMRSEYLKELFATLLSPEQQQSHTELFGGELEFEFDRGWPWGKPYAEHLNETGSRDAREKRLRSGAHFFDLRISLNGSPAKDVFSRGQKKLLGLKLKLAQISLYNSQPNRPSCIVLVDDLAAEVDRKNQQLAISEIIETGSQVFLTSVDRHQIEGVIPEDINTKMFHVKQGVITEIN